MKSVLVGLVVFTLMGVGFALEQQNGVRTVHGRGRNADYRTAINEALVQAMSQVQGVSLQDSRDQLMDSLKQFRSSKSQTEDVDEIRESMKQTVSARTHGRVLSYEITEERYDKEGKMWYVELDARVPGQYQLGLPEGNRRRMVVMPFKALTEKVSVYGQEMQSRLTCESIARKLNENLTQTRRFTMLDRAFNEDVQAELSRLNYENASAVDFGRFQQLLVTDYMVIGTVKMYSSPTASYNQYTGSTSASDGPFVEISYRVLLVPTSQLKWAGSFVVPYSMCGGSSPDTVFSSAISVAADGICNEIIENIYPIRVTAKNTFELVLNQGGTNIRVGEIMDVFRRGEEVTDVSSGETLGAPEEQIARVRIVRVTPKMSYAVFAEGTPLDQIEIGAVVRRSKGFAGYGQQPGVVSPVRTGPGGTVVPPWKK